MNKKTQLEKFGHTIQKRRKALNMSVRTLAQKSGISAALISKLENGIMQNFPKQITIEHLSKSLEFKNNELFILADIFIESIDKKERSEETFEEKLRKLLATHTSLNSENINQSIYFIKGLQILQQINENKNFCNDEK